jgi:putative selenium metabolism protein SsnA
VSRIVVENATLFTGAGVQSPAAVVIDGETVVGIHPAGPAAEPGEARIDAAGRLVTPGFINAHTHIYSALARGITLEDPPPVRFREILERLWWRLDRALDFETIDLSARLHAVECLRAGVTTIFDHHSSQRAARGSLETISRALEDFGLRACLCFEVSDRDGEAAAAAGIEENVAFIRATSGSGGSMRRARFGLHAPFTLSDATLKACARSADPDEVGFHVHLAEGEDDPPTAAARLRDAGILGRKTICVHGVHLDDAQSSILAETGAWLVHCPESNMNNAVGVVSLERVASAGVRLALGSDGFTAVMAREALVAHLMQNHLCGSPGSGYAVVPDLLLRRNRLLATETFGIEIGRIFAGGPADLVVWDYDPPTPLSVDNLWGHLLFGLTAARASEVIIAGRWVLRDGRAGREEAELAGRCREAAARLWERF